MTDLTLFEGQQVSPFDSIRQVDEHGAEYWSARDMMPLQGYGADWRNFVASIDRAKATAVNQGMDPAELFVAVTEKSGGRPREDYRLSRYAAYLVAMNGDPRKPEVAAAQSYFAIRTREAESAPSRELTGPELMARALIEADSTIKAQQAQLEEAKPKAEAWDSFLSSTGDVSVNEAAKEISRNTSRIIGEKRLRNRLEDWGWIYRHQGKPRAKQAQVDLGRLTERARFHFHPETGERVMDTPQVRVTAKGLDAIRTRLSQEAAA
ncbi:phage antirepressor Ant [Kocuria salina]|uniref:phage antirepressor KilAC domain-containing protein n=1 Tax=Kocuria salina TaxID=1929416 RepID=UPI0015946B43|nr:phage antirepressor KilAC domain-containing protein [Kocuria salina]NVC23368.1 phage antirepressor Ant [Kocuria salina]